MQAKRLFFQLMLLGAFCLGSVPTRAQVFGYVANYSSNKVSVINTPTNAAVATVNEEHYA